MNLRIGEGPKKHGDWIHLRTPTEFRFSEALVYLTRSPEETLYRVQGDSQVIRLVELLSSRVFLKVACFEPGWLSVMVVGDHSPDIQGAAVQYICDWFDLHCNLASFYKLAQADKILAPLVTEFYGLRLIGVPDLFEALCWAVIGQQINLAFAYTLKRRFVQMFGISDTLDGEMYWLFPVPERIAQLHVADLQKLQMTRRKSEYIIGISREIVSGRLSKAELLRQGAEEAKRTLTGIRGVGDWTANYVAMRCLRDQSAFPVGDVGLQNAVKQRLGMDRKLTPAELVEIGINWIGWEAYATFYLWRSLQGMSA